MHLLKTLFLDRSTKLENYREGNFTFRFQEEKVEFARKINEPDDGCGTCGFWRESLQPCNKCGKVIRDLIAPGFFCPSLTKSRRKYQINPLISIETRNHGFIF